jgi:thioesterase domain-containing protein
VSEIFALVSSLRKQDIKLWLDGDKLKCSAPKDALNAETRQTLASRKAEIVAFLRDVGALADAKSTIVPIKRQGTKPPMFAVSGHGGDVFCLRELARQLDPEQPVIGIQPPGLDGGEPLISIEALARFEIEQIRRYCPKGPYLIAGHCAGGTLAFEVAQQLKAADEEVRLLALIGAPFPTSFSFTARKMLRLHQIAKRLTTGTLKERRNKILEKLSLAGPSLEEQAGITPEVKAARDRVERATVAACAKYRPSRYDGQIDLFIAADRWHKSEKWKDYAQNVREYRMGDFDINELLIGGHVEVLAKFMNKSLSTI